MSDAEKSLTADDQQAKIEALKKRSVITEFGTGILKRIGTSPFVTVELEHGHSVRLRKSQVFLPTGTETSATPKQIAHALGLKLAPNTVTEPAESWKPSLFMTRKLAKETKLTTAKAKLLAKPQPLSFKLDLFQTNGYLCLDFFLDEGDPSSARVLQGYGFRVTHPYHYAHVPTGKALTRQLADWKSAGLVLSPDLVKNGAHERFRAVADLIRSKQLGDESTVFQTIVDHSFDNFYTQDTKPSNNPNRLLVYPIIQNGSVYIAMPDNQASSEIARNNSRSSIEWESSEASMSYFGSLTMVKAVVSALRKDGHTVSNYRTLRRRFEQFSEVDFRWP